MLGSEIVHGSQVNEIKSLPKPNFALFVTNKSGHIWMKHNVNVK